MLRISQQSVRLNSAEMLQEKPCIQTAVIQVFQKVCALLINFPA
jgi:hypothetical protein